MKEVNNLQLMEISTILRMMLPTGSINGDRDAIICGSSELVKMGNMIKEIIEDELKT